ncbi:BolA family protein [Vibrio salinus]|uniref:BolA family protein n=1 Tax=Vibrio salinus TaxID=2899784 RepID=UPI001E38FE7F|nr:BolA/IbaG family iron-sulfur metabolism protein [Vibrio salinus]MCE0494350.1 BolA/IbaG family iron-sulfur metabolism protein [Vibrio salinus]
MIQDTIESKLTEALAPHHLEVVNESYMHNVPAGSESHFKIVVVSDEFKGKRQVARHRRIYQILDNELNNGVHALSMHIYTPDEWISESEVPESPMCQGGEKKGFKQNKTGIDKFDR